MKLSTASAVPVYTISGSDTGRALPDWLVQKRRRSLKQDSEYANRIELLQDFEFEEASNCIRVSEDGNWLVSTGTYKPQIHVHNLPQLSLSYSRHTISLNETFQLLSSDASKSIHLQADRTLEFHTQQACHQSVRIPRYGRDLQYDGFSTEALVPAVGVNEYNKGEVFRFNLEAGRFLKAYEVDVGGDSRISATDRALQGGTSAGAVNCAAVAHQSHNLFGFGTSQGTVEFWDPRARARAAALSARADFESSETLSGITAISFHPSGLTLATGSSTGIIYLYDLRSPEPLLRKDQGYSYPIKNLLYLTSPSNAASAPSTDKILSADKRIIKLWDARDGSPWTSVEPTVDLNDVAWIPDTGMLMTANEGKQQHAFFIPSLGQAPRWCSFLDNMVEELAAPDSNDQGVFTRGKVGEVYDNYKFLDLSQLRALSLDHLVGQTSLLRPYMHGYFVAQRLYEEARVIANPQLWQEQRAKTIQEKIDKERESRIRGNKRLAVKVNRKLVERVLEKEDKAQRKKAHRLLKQPGPSAQNGDAPPMPADPSTERATVLTDPRFAQLFSNADFAIDEQSQTFHDLHADASREMQKQQRGLTAVEDEEHERAAGAQSSDPDASSDDASSGDEMDGPRRKSGQSHVSISDYRRRRHRSAPGKVPQMVRSPADRPRTTRHGARSFGSQAAALKGKDQRRQPDSSFVHGDREVTFLPQKTASKNASKRDDHVHGRATGAHRGRRSASGNVFRNM